MSNNVLNSKYSLHLLLTTTRLQALSIILTATDEQVKTISETTYNLLQLPLTLKEKEFIQKRRKLFKKIADRNLTKKKKLLFDIIAKQL